MNIFDVDNGGGFGIDTIYFIVNGNIVTDKNEIENYAISKRLDVKIIFIQTKKIF